MLLREITTPRDPSQHFTIALPYLKQKKNTLKTILIPAYTTTSNCTDGVYFVADGKRRQPEKNTHKDLVVDHQELASMGSCTHTRTHMWLRAGAREMKGE